MKTNNEIAEAMAGILNPEAIKRMAQNVSVHEAIKSRDKAAHILDNMGHFVAAEALTEVIEKIPTTITESD